MLHFVSSELQFQGLPSGRSAALHRRSQGSPFRAVQQFQRGFFGQVSDFVLIDARDPVSRLNTGTIARAASDDGLHLQTAAAHPGSEANGIITQLKTLGHLESVLRREGLQRLKFLRQPGQQFPIQVAAPHRQLPCQGLAGGGFCVGNLPHFGAVHHEVPCVQLLAWQRTVGHLIDDHRGEGLHRFAADLPTLRFLEEQRHRRHVHAPGEQDVAEVGKVHHAPDIHCGEQPAAEPGRLALKQRHGRQHHAGDAFLPQAGLTLPNERLRELIPASRRCVFGQHPVQGQLVTLILRRILEFLPRGIADDPVKLRRFFPAVHGLRPRAVGIKEVRLEDVVTAQLWQAKVLIFSLQVRRVHIIKQRHEETHLGDAAGISIAVHSKNLVLQNAAQLRRRQMIPATGADGAFNEHPVSLHQKRAAAATGVRHLHTRPQRKAGVHFRDHEVH